MVDARCLEDLKTINPLQAVKQVFIFKFYLILIVWVVSLCQLNRQLSKHIIYIATVFAQTHNAVFVGQNPQFLDFYWGIYDVTGPSGYVLFSNLIRWIQFETISPVLVASKNWTCSNKLWQKSFTFEQRGDLCNAAAAYRHTRISWWGCHCSEE